MGHVVCVVPVSPMRKESAHRSEMVSQLLFGETAEILELGKSFTRIRSLYDNYEGWCQSAQLLPVSDEMAHCNRRRLTDQWVTSISINGKDMQVSLGTPLDMLTNVHANLGNYEITCQSPGMDPAANIFEESAIRAVSMQYLNTAYLWGGRSVFGIDCSGFVQQVFRFFNKKLPRDAYMQALSGEVVGFLQEARCGDLAFFDNENGHITHVGMLWNADTIIHASGVVRIDKIDTMGIVHTDTGERTHKLRIIKRYETTG